MPIKRNLDQVFAKPVDRRGFLAGAGATLLVLTGISGILGGLGLHDNRPQRSSGYGSTSYGGKEEPTSGKRG